MAGYFFRFVAPKIAKNLTGRFKAKQDMFKTVDKAAGPNVSSQKKSKIKKDIRTLVQDRGPFTYGNQQIEQLYKKLDNIFRPCLRMF